MELTRAEKKQPKQYESVDLVLELNDSDLQKKSPKLIKEILKANWIFFKVQKVELYKQGIITKKEINKLKSMSPMSAEAAVEYGLIDQVLETRS